MISKQDLDFEISFYKNILKDRPNFVNALIALGEAYTRRGRYKEGLKVDKRLLELKPDDPTVHYNLACSYSLLKMPAACLRHLKKAITLGYRDFAFIEKDPDLEFIRKDPRYKELLSKYADNL
ncbi:MAG: tetratricopeptide repeat protein [Candidatus Omnitrophica bacterium]|nr:tetratricopeptide repeat protein [Candidatus Omnitrophota bacterium]MBU1871606.1 tetratricopeptide repeat protein [Candidatus Omnitrophota bacterium]